MSQPAVQQHRPKGVGAISLALAGIGAAFGVASCCALPILLASVGIGSAWLGGVAMVAFPYRDLLLVVAALCLLGGGGLLIRQQLAAARCGPNGTCTPVGVRAVTLAGLLVGGVLLWLGYRYV